ncbi:MAG TPA: biopolymer transporter ExbD [Thermoanaerobaculia bacterium]|jgi:biopolymer transport protein ExbD|nr:biopolymer transporter ExbD [Thermoanaerobaculia bacterium]
MSARTKVISLMRGTLHSEINVTPLVDICLVLLIVFMVITPTICKGSAVQVPETRNPRTLPAEAPRIAVSLQRDGLVFIDRRLVPAERLEATLGEISAANPDRTILLEADRRLPYRDVRLLVEKVQAAGLSRVALAADRQVHR